MGAEDTLCMTRIGVLQSKTDNYQTVQELFTVQYNAL
jgi:hypothetical protein